MRLLQFLSVALLLQLNDHVANAYPSSAGGCEGGVAAVAGSHVTAPNVEEGPLSAGDYTLRINGDTIRPNIPQEVPIGVDLEWEITGRTAFKGFLVRLDGGRANVDTTAALQPLPATSGSVQVAETVCVSVFGVGGVTHTSSAVKDGVSGSLFLAEPSRNMNLDVTVVVENQGGNSEYYYSGFTLHAVEPSAPDTSQRPQDGGDEDEEEETDPPQEEDPESLEEVESDPPEEEETDPPEEEETDPPEEEETDPPEEEETEPPEEEETDPPEEEETDPPEEEETDPPEEEETESPEEEETDSPEEEETDPPEEEETDPPEEEETEPPVDEETDPPEVEETDPPSPAPTVSAPAPRPPPAADDDGDFTLESFTPQCSVDRPCGICQGDCDEDFDCADGLACFQRDDWDWTPVPGCQGEGFVGTDYCFDPAAYPLALQAYPEDCTAADPCDECKGDCDNDDQCIGTLECFQRPPGGNATVPGCYGLGRVGGDYCFDRANLNAVPNNDDEEVTSPTWAPTSENSFTYEPTSEGSATWTPTSEGTDTWPPTSEGTGTWPPTFAPTSEASANTDTAGTALASGGQCAPGRPCGICRGDCDSDIECEGQLACFQRDEFDLTPVPGCQGEGRMGMDYCFDPIAHPYALQTYPDDCSAEFPCDKCKGDCDNDNQCKGTLSCFQRPPDGTAAIPGCYGIGLAGADYCFDRDDMVVLDDDELEFFPTKPPNTEDEMVEAFDDDEQSNTESQDEAPAEAPTTKAPVQPVMFYPPTAEPFAEETPTFEPTWEQSATFLPTSEGSDEGTNAFDVVGGNSQGGYQFGYYNTLTQAICSISRPCDVCEGDCDHDDQCEGNLECYPRRVGEYTPVPGCSGKGLAGNDYCHAADRGTARPRITPCSPQDPCKRCQGDCDTHADCQGNLMCFHRERFDPTYIPGCNGNALGNVDYCVAAADHPNGHLYGNGDGDYFMVGKAEEHAGSGGGDREYFTVPGGAAGYQGNAHNGGGGREVYGMIAGLPGHPNTGGDREVFTLPADSEDQREYFTIPSAGQQHHGTAHTGGGDRQVFTMVAGAAEHPATAHTHYRQNRQPGGRYLRKVISWLAR